MLTRTPCYVEMERPILKGRPAPLRGPRNAHYRGAQPFTRSFRSTWIEHRVQRVIVRRRRDFPHPQNGQGSPADFALELAPPECLEKAQDYTNTMPFDSTISVDPARHNQLDQRQNGILDYDERNVRTEGQAALDFGSGSAAIELDIEGANLLLDGTKTSCPPNTVTLSDGNSSGLWRTDHIYATEAGNFAVAEGEPGDNRYVVHEIDSSDPTNPQITHSIVENEHAGGPRPKGSDFSQGSGELLWSVLVPPGARTSADLNENHLWDRRRGAVDLLDLGPPRQPTIVSHDLEFLAGQWRVWPIVTWPNQTFRLWEYTLTSNQHGFMADNDFRFYIVDHNEIEGGIPGSEFSEGVDWSKYAIWQSSQNKQTSGGDPEDIIVDIDTGPNSDAHAFIVENSGDFNYRSNTNRMGLQVTYTLENTADL